MTAGERQTYVVKNGAYFLDQNGKTWSAGLGLGRAGRWTKAEADQMAAGSYGASVHHESEFLSGKPDQRTFQPGGETFQARVLPWLLECFGDAVTYDRTERSHRFLEEALELVQATGTTAAEAHQLVDYVFGRPVGQIGPEVGGVEVTLAALCLAQGVDKHSEAETELARVWTLVEKIRAKHARKPKFSPLPGATEA